MSKLSMEAFKSAAQPDMTPAQIADFTNKVAAIPGCHA